MPAVPTAPELSDGVLLPSMINDGVLAVANFLMDKPRAKIRQSVAQTLTTAVNTVITFDAEDLDANPADQAQHDTVTNNSRFTAAYPGWYFVAGGCSFASNATGIRMVRWLINGVVPNDVDALLGAVSGNTTRIPARGYLAYLNEGDYIEMQVVQTSGGNLNTAVSTTGEQPCMSIFFAGIA